MYKCGSVILIHLSTRQAWTTTHVKWYPSLHCIVTPSDSLHKKHFESDWIRWEQPFWRSPNEPLPQSTGYQLLSIPPSLGKFWKWNSTTFKEPHWEFSLCIPLFESNFCCYLWLLFLAALLYHGTILLFVHLKSELLLWFHTVSKLG